MTPLVDTVAAPPFTERLRQTFPARTDQVARMRRAVAHALCALGWPEDAADGILLAVGEACSNAVNYGQIEDGRATVTVIVRAPSLCRVEVEVRNPGGRFRPDLDRLRLLPDDDATCGRGFALMDALMDSVEVRSEGQETVVRLGRRRPL